ncbi:hypothetical protein JCM8115_000497 [Rhodotorula mucilaginosa]
MDMERSATLPVTARRNPPTPRRAPHPPRAALHTLPPELLAQIFHPGPDPSAAASGEEDEFSDESALHLSPRSIPICRSLLPFTRKNAYHHIELEGGLDGLERFGKVVDEREGAACQWIGGLVKRVTVRASSPQGADTRSVPDGYLRAAFDALENVERVDLELSGTEWQRLVSPASPSSSPLRSRAFNRSKEEGGISLRVRLVEDDPCPVGLVTLAQIGCSGGARGIRSLKIQGRLPHRRQCGDGRGSSGDAEGTVTPPLMGDGEEGEMWTGLEKLEMQCEPHSVGLTRFFGSLAGLKELCWTTPGTTDPSMVAAALPMNVCSTLEVLEWTSFGYTSRELGFAFSNLPSLRSLTIRSSSAVLSQPFFVALHAHNPHLEHLALRGPHAGTPGVRGAADTCALVAEWVEALLFEAGQGGEAASALRRLELEVPTPTPAFARPASARLASEERPPTRLEVQASRLAVACARLDVTLGGSVLDAIPRRALK